jgi:hypothetical protein
LEAETLHVLVKHKVFDEPLAEEQRTLLREFAHAYGPNANSPMECPREEFANRRFSAGTLLPRAYCYLAYCSKIIEICTKRSDDGRPATARLWGYVMWSTMDADMRAEFGRAMAADAGDDAVQEVPVSTSPLKEAVTSMIRAMIFDNDLDGLRELVRWAYNAHEPYLKALIDESHSDDRWMANVAELIPRLVLRTCIPLHDSVAVRDPKIVLAAYASSAAPLGFNDPGVLMRRSTFVRTLFAEPEIRVLEQAGQRISELFAHVYPLLLIADRRQEMTEIRERVCALNRQRGHLRALQHIETLYRHSLRIPTWVYRELKSEISGPAH